MSNKYLTDEDSERLRVLSNDLREIRSSDIDQSVTLMRLRMAAHDVKEIIDRVKDE